MKAHTQMHQVIIIIVIIAPVTLCYFIMSHATTNSLLSRTHVNTTHLLNTTCTLVAVGVILGRLVCRRRWVFTLRGTILTSKRTMRLSLWVPIHPTSLPLWPRISFDSLRHPSLTCCSSHSKPRKFQLPRRAFQPILESQVIVITWTFIPLVTILHHLICCNYYCTLSGDSSDEHLQ